MKNLMKVLFVFFFVLSLTIVKGQETVKDYDGNVYKTIKVGNQTWMAENLRVTHFRNGQEIPNVKEDKQWDALTSSAYCDVANNPSRAEGQGRLYNWYVIADERNVCPAGWHVPSEAEWQTLVKYLSGNSGAKEINGILFKVLQEDFRGYDGGFSGNGYGGGAWWSSTPVNGELAFYHGINYDTASKNRMEGRKKFGYSIRCVKDAL
jgi:uncharacterized protein (TIGR02145 family)